MEKQMPDDLNYRKKKKNMKKIYSSVLGQNVLKIVMEQILLPGNMVLPA